MIARNLWKHHRMLPPDSKFKHNWDNVMLLFVLYTCTMVPLQLAFDDGEGFTYHDAHAVLDYLIDARLHRRHRDQLPHDAATTTSTRSSSTRASWRSGTRAATSRST